MPRGRPKGSKNKVSRKVEAPRYVIGTGSKQWEFPIVREGSVTRVAVSIGVNAESFTEALQAALAWALRYSEKENESSRDIDVYFWPLISYHTLIGNEKRYVKRIDKDYPVAYCENANEGSWLSLGVLERI